MFTEMKSPAPWGADKRLTASLKTHLDDDLGLLDAPAPEAFDALTRLAQRVFKAPVSLISIIDEKNDRQFFASQQGLKEPWASARQTPLSHSFCQHVKAAKAPLVVCKADEHPLVRDNLAIRGLDVMAYLGVPVHSPDGEVIGALCVIDSCERSWTPDEVETLTDIAQCAKDEILLRIALRANESTTANVLRSNVLRESISNAFLAPDLEIDERFAALLKATCRALGMEHGLITRVDGDRIRPLFGEWAQTPGAKARAGQFRGSLTSLIVGEGRTVAIADISASTLEECRTADGYIPGRFLGAPLKLAGVVHGTIEFRAAQPRKAPWQEDEVAMLDVVSMFAAAHLGVFGRLQALRESESALLSYCLDKRHGAAAELYGT